MRRFALSIPLGVMPQNPQPVMVLAHCKATVTEVAEKEVKAKTLFYFAIASTCTKY